MENLKLYVTKTWPFCVKVVDFLNEQGLEVEILNIDEDPKNREELKRIGGKIQVPMLLINGKPLYESNDIIKWCKKNK